MSRKWEEGYYNSYGNYTDYRFKDFAGQCKHLDRENFNCNHSQHACAGSTDPECLCDFCPFVVRAEDKEAPDAFDYSEGDQPILVLDRKFRPGRGMSPKVTKDA